MTAIASCPRSLPSLALARAGTDAPPLAFVTLVLLAMMPVTLLAMWLDPRTLDGASVWLKPLKFEIALMLYAGTLAIVARWLPDALRRSRAWSAYLWVVVAAILLEMVWIGGAAAAGVRSHFNAAPAMMAIYQIMGVLAVTLTSASAAFGVALRRAALPAPVRAGLVQGLIATFALTVVVAGAMASRSGAVVGPTPTGATVPLFGWSAEAGDLRIAHFAATHALHAVPLWGLAAWRLGLGVRAVALGTAAYAALTLAAFLWVLQGNPLPGL